MPARQSTNTRIGERGQASVELIAAVPFLLVVGAVCWQLVLTGHALWTSAQAARAAARADVVGSDPRAAARSVLPGYLERGLTVRRSGDGVAVRVRVPLLIARWGSPVRVGARSSFGGR